MPISVPLYLCHVKPLFFLFVPFFCHFFFLSPGHAGLSALYVLVRDNRMNDCHLCSRGVQAVNYIADSDPYASRSLGSLR